MKPRTSFMLVCLLCTCSLSRPTTANAEESPGDLPRSPPRSARLVLPECAEPPFVIEELIALLRVELLAEGVELVSELDADLSLVIDAPECRAAAITIRVENGHTDQELRTNLVLTDRPLEERSRVLALAVAELLRAPAEERATAAVTNGEEGPEPVAEAQCAPPCPPPPEPDPALLREQVADEVARVLEAREARESSAERRTHLGAAIALWGFPLYSGAFIAGQLRLSFLLSRRVPIELTLEGGYGYGGGTTPRGEVDTHAAGGGLGLVYVAGRARLKGEVGLRFWLGRGWTEGHTTLETVETDSGTAFLTDLSVVGAFRFRLAGRLWLRTEATVGYVLQGLVPQSGGWQVGGFAGPSFRIGIGLDVEL